ncbi:MAG: N-6 DNA methylase [Chloroflexi bacterium]|nr:N-6 DNA methylase [Chloroflexota bacterium]
MSERTKPFQQYVAAIDGNLRAGVATERTYYPALKSLLESISQEIMALNEPKRVECGAPDFLITRGSVTVGYVEAKDIDKSLDEVEQTDQLKRYRDSLTNLVLTNYLEFRWYVDGERRLSARLGMLAKDGKVKGDGVGIEDVAELLASFLSHRAEAVGTPRELAQHMARRTRLIRDLIIAAFEKERERGSLHTQLSAFRDNLIPDLSPGQFADMYAQTIAYGLFAARGTNSEGKGFTRQNAAYLLPKTNPFLRKLFNHIAGPDLDDRIAWLVDDLAEMLAQADMASILRDFGKRTAREDPVVHFYETFLADYDPRVREMRGVYYTPEPVVSYIVRSIDYLLKTRFNKPRGLADPNIYILDPAVGTATFLYMVVNEIYQAMVSQGQKGMWNDYVDEKLLPRLFGFELLMAPYAVAHLKLGLLLQETGYDLGGQARVEQAGVPVQRGGQTGASVPRLGIYLTNTLEEAIKRSETLFAQWITEEANAAAEIKKEKPIMVVLGNPPYSGHSANKGAWAKQLVEQYKTVDGKPLGEKNPKWLQDDYVKFIRFGQWRIERTGQGILGFITNHAYLDNPTFRGMRQSLMNTFDEIYIFDLHGNVKKREAAPDGGKDENVFDIQQGVAIALFVKEPVGQAPSPVRNIGQTGASVLSVPEGPARVHHAELWGLRAAKYRNLSETDVSTTDWAELKPDSPFYFFVRREEELRPEYERGWKVTDIFPVNSVGIVTGQDRETIGLTEEEANRLATKHGLSLESVTKILYRPFDLRYVVYHRTVVTRTRHEVMRHMLAGENLGLICPRRVETIGAWQHVICSNHAVEHVAVSLKTIDSVFPLYLYPSEGEMQFDSGRRPNLSPAFVAEVERRLGVRFVPHPLIPKAHPYLPPLRGRRGDPGQKAHPYLPPFRGRRGDPGQKAHPYLPPFRGRRGGQRMR